MALAITLFKKMFVFTVDKYGKCYMPDLYIFKSHMWPILLPM